MLWPTDASMPCVCDLRSPCFPKSPQALLLAVFSSTGPVTCLSAAFPSSSRDCWHEPLLLDSRKSNQAKAFREAQHPQLPHLWGSKDPASNPSGLVIHAKGSCRGNGERHFIKIMYCWKLRRKSWLDFFHYLFNFVKVLMSRAFYFWEKFGPTILL